MIKLEPLNGITLRKLSHIRGIKERIAVGQIYIFREETSYPFPHVRYDCLKILEMTDESFYKAGLITPNTIKLHCQRLFSRFQHNPKRNIIDYTTDLPDSYVSLSLLVECGYALKPNALKLIRALYD